LKRKAVIIDWDKPVLRLYAVNDTHVGSVASCEDKQGRLAKIVAEDEYGMIIGAGDYIEAIAPSDRRFDPHELSTPIVPELIHNIFYIQALRFCKIWAPTAGKWAMMVTGNHESKAAKMYHIDAAAVIAERMSAPYTGSTLQSGWLKVRLRNKNGKYRYAVDIYVTHGWGGGELRGGDALKLQRLTWKKNADVVLVAHTHRGMIFPESVDVLNRAGYEEPQMRWGVISMPITGKHTYLENRGGTTPVAGYARIDITRRHDGQPDIDVSLRTL